MLLKKICHIYQRNRNSQITSTIKADRFAFLKLNLSAYLSATNYSYSIKNGLLPLDC